MKKSILIYYLAILVFFIGILYCNTSLAENITTEETNENSLFGSLDESEKETFNALFETYKGSDISGARIKSLIQAVMSSNASNDSRQVKINLELSDVESSLKYNVKCNYDDDGYINEIIVEKVSNTTNVENNNIIIENTDDGSYIENNLTSNTLESNSTTADSEIPKTGISNSIYIIIFIVIGLSIIFNLINKKYTDVK